MASLTEGQIRSLLGDPAGATQILSSSEYTNILSLESTPYRQLALACKTLAAYYATKVSISTGAVRVSLGQKYEHYMILAKNYDSRAQSGGGGGGSLTPIATGILISEIDALLDDTDTVVPSFTHDMMSPSSQYYDYEVDE